MSGGPSIFSMITGIGKSFDDSYDAAEKSRLEREAPNLISDYMRAASGGAAAPVPGTTLGTIGQGPAPGRSVPAFAATDGAMGDYLATTRAKESGGNDLAANPNSTAKGRYQFTDSTWAGVAKRHPDLGLQPGGWRDPDQQERAMAAFTADNAKALTAAGIPINPGNLYVSHFLGEAGGPKFIAGAMSNPDAPAVAFVSPGAARANRSIFFDPDGRPKTAGAVYAERTGRFAGGGPAQVPTLPAPGGGVPSMVAAASPLAAQRPVQVAENEAQTQALEQRMGMTPGTATAEADMPAADAVPAQFQIPGQAAPAAPAAAGFAGFGTRTTRSSPEQMAALQAMWRNPNTRAIATQIYGSVLKGEDSAWTLSSMGDQPVLFNAKTAQIVPVGQAKRSTATVGNAVVDTATGQVIYQGPDKDADKLQSVAPGTTLYDPRARQPVFTAPDREAETKDEGAKIAAQVAARKREAAGLGLKEGTPAWQAYVGTGKIGRDQDLSATDKKAIQEADEGVLSAQTAIEALGQAKTLSKQAYEGPTAGARGTITSIFGSDDGIATQDLHNVVTTNALGQLKAIFGGNPTEGERKILLDIQGSVNQPDAVRQKIFDRGIALAQKRLDFNQRRAEDMRGGTYYKQDGAPGGPKPAEPRNSLPVRVTPQMKPEDVMKRYPSGTRLILPDGTEGVVP